MFLFLQLKVRLKELSNIYQAEFDQSPAQACAIDLPELNYGLWSNYLIVIKVEDGLQLHFKIFLNKSDRKKQQQK